MSEEQFPYIVIDEYVRGGCSVIYRVKPVKTDENTQASGKTLVLKTMIPDDDDPADEKRFYMEYEFLRAYPHPNLIEVLDYFPKWRGNPAYIMEWVEGDTWQTFWDGKNAMEQLALFFEILEQLCNVLDFIHKHQIIHRDLKPQNILITKEKQLKLIDFGIMKVQDLSLYTNRNSFMGSAYYVAPECLSGDDVTRSADIFSLGVMIYDLLTGAKPFRGHTLAETVYQRLVSVPKPPSTFRDLPKELDNFFEKILHLEPHRRQSSCQMVFNELYEILGKDIPSKPSQATEPTELDVCTQTQFLHNHFLVECLPILEKNNVLYLTGPAGVGKDTIVENLPNYFPIKHIIKTDIHESLTQNELIEIILAQIGTPNYRDPKTSHWLSILATALPQLEWKVPAVDYQIHNSSVLSAFLNLLQNFKQKTLILLTCVEPPSAAVLQFLNHFFFFLKRECSAPFFTVFTSEKPFKRLTNIIPNREVPFPDLVTLSDFVSAQFNQASVPLDVTNRLGNESDHHLKTFLKLVEQHKISSLLRVKDGILQLEIDPMLKTTLVSSKNTVPQELGTFSREQLSHLEWLALNPEGVDISVLKQLTQVDLETLSRTLTIAKENDLLDFKTGSTQGLIWKKKTVRDFLLKSMDREEYSKRCKILAQTIEEVSQPYLPYSPPLWRILSRLFRDGDESTKGSTYAIRYSRYCFQNAQYEAIRTTLSPFETLPSLQNNHEFWFLLAMAYRNEDAHKALEYGKRALNIQQDPQTKALMVILEYGIDHYKESFKMIETIFAKEEQTQLDINMSLEVCNLLLAANQVKRAKDLIALQENKVKQESDPFAEQINLLARMQVKEQYAPEAIIFSKTLPPDLLPSSREKVLHLRKLCHISLFQFEEGESTLKSLLDFFQKGPDRENRGFTNQLFFYLCFHKFKVVRKLLASEDAKIPDNRMLVEIVSQFLTRDPQLYSEDYLSRKLEDSKLSKTIWVPLVTSLLDPEKVPLSLVGMAVSFCRYHIPFWCRHQTPRFTLIQKIVQGEYSDLPNYLHMAINYAQKYHLVMESLYLENIQNRLFSLGILTERIANPLHEHVLASQPNIQFFSGSLS